MKLKFSRDTRHQFKVYKTFGCDELAQLITGNDTNMNESFEMNSVIKVLLIF